MRWRRLVSFCTALASATATGADIGGWMEQNSRTDLLIDECPQIVALASQTAQALIGVPPARVRREAEGAAQLYYASGMCYVVSEKVARDNVAAAAWLVRAAELDHPLARRALTTLRESGAAAWPHGAGHHCHDLGLGQRLCHGSAAPR